jgi:hypothetical protein
MGRLGALTSFWLGILTSRFFELACFEYLSSFESPVDLARTRWTTDMAYLAIRLH